MIQEFKPTILDGLDNFTYRARGHSAEIFTDSNGVALKLYENRFENDAAYFEYLVLKQLKQTNLSCPRLIDAVQVKDRWGFRYQWIEANRFKDEFHKQFWNLKNIARLYADLHHEVHCIEGFKDLPDQKFYYSEVLDKQSHLDAGSRARLLEQLSELPSKNLLCHGDFNPKNTLMGTNTAYAIDWQNSYRGNPLGDVAKTFVKLSFFAFTSDRTNQFEKLWLQRFCRRYLKNYSERRRLDTPEFFQWIAIAAGVQSRTMEKPKQDWYKHLVSSYYSHPERLRKYVYG